MASPPYRFLIGVVKINGPGWDGRGLHPRRLLSRDGCGPALLLAAGFAPAFKEQTLQESDLASVRQAVDRDMNLIRRWRWTGTGLW